MTESEKLAVVELIRDCADAGIELSRAVINIDDTGTRRVTKIEVEIKQVGDDPRIS